MCAMYLISFPLANKSMKMENEMKMNAFLSFSKILDEKGDDKYRPFIG